MSKDKDLLPEKIPAFRFAEASTFVKGTLLIKDMHRLCSSLFEKEGLVSVEMQFGMDAEKIALVRGRVEASLMLQCQRCMEPYRHKVASDFVSGIVKTEEAASRLPDSYDVILSEDGTFLVQERIEDELMISLPIVPMHDLRECKMKETKILLEAGRENHENPFKVIEILKTKE